MEESLLNPEPKVNSEFYKKLQQQIVQKDNIIKLLQLRVKNLEEDRGSQAPAAEPQAARQLQELQRSETALREQNEALVRRAGKDEESINDLEARLALAADELARREEELAHVQALAPGGDDKKLEKLWSQVASLESKLAKREEELARARAELAEVKPPGETVREVNELRRDVERLRADKLHLEQTLGQLKEQTSADGLIGEAVARKEEELRTHELDRQRLAEEVERLKTKLEETRLALANTSPTGSFQLVQAIITLFQRLQDLRDKVGPQKEFGSIENSLREVSALIGLERIKSIGKTADPELHQITDVLYSTEHPHNTIVRESSIGYACHSSVVKMAEVVVSRNPYWCKRCERVAAEGSRYCNICGEKVMGRESPDLKLLDSALTAKSFLDVAIAKEADGETAEAEKAFQHSLEIDRENPGALWGLVRVREALGRYREALDGLERLKDQPHVTEDLERVKNRLKTKIEIVERLQGLF